jgi:hypothetical protein
MDLPTGTLVLSTSMLISSTPRDYIAGLAVAPTSYYEVFDFGAKGASNVFFSEVTFRNVDLNAIVGPMYWEYDMFNLVLKAYAGGSTNTASNSDYGYDFNDNAFMITLSGFQTLCDNDSPEAIIAAMTTPQPTGNTEKMMSIQFPGNNILTIVKTDRSFIDLTVRFRRSADLELLNFSKNNPNNYLLPTQQTVPTAIEPMPAWQLLFDIFPVTSTYKKGRMTLERNVR